MEQVIEGYDLSVQQERIWATRAGRRTEAQALLKFSGGHTAAEVRAAVVAAYARHEILRTRFVVPPGLSSPLQVVEDVVDLGWAEHDLTGLSEVERQERIDDEASSRRAAGPVASLVLFTRYARATALLVTADPLRVDRTTFLILATELCAALQGADLGEQPLPYGAFAEWQRSRLRGNGVGAAGGPAGISPWPVGVSTGAPVRHVVSRSSPNTLAAAVCEYARAHGVPVDAILVAAFKVLLRRSVGSDDAGVGIPVSGRVVGELAQAYGPFEHAATLTAPIDLDGDFTSLVRRVATRIESVKADADVVAPWPECVVAINTTGDTATEPVTVVRVAWTIIWTGIHDLWVDVDWNGADGFSSSWQYDGARLSEEYVGVLSRRYEALLSALIAASDRPVGEHDLLSPEERDSLLVGVNRTARPYRLDVVHRLVEQRAAADPGRTAVVADDGELTYRRLNDLSNRLAARLRGDGVGPESLVGVSLGHGVALPVALLAVLKAGGAYVPVDLTLPQRRSAQLLAGCSVLICADDRPFDGVRHRLDDLRDLERDGPPTPLEPSAPGLDGAAYVIYTSGSTGTPKGVVVTHRGLANYMLWSAETYLGDAPGTSVAHSPIGFDLTVTSLLSPLAAGATVRLIRGADQNPAVLAAALLSHPEIELIKLTPAHLRVLNQELAARGATVTGKTLVVGGEALSGDLIAPWHGSRIVNEYGPTEAVVGCVIHDIPAADGGPGPVSIGRPAPNTVVYVLDAELRPAGIGVPGEIYLGGAQLARGYLGAPGLTADRFIPDPYSTAGGRLYRTGDLACHLPGGELRFLGRADDQVKIRGVRVEPAELEAQLRDHPAVQDAAVVARRTEIGARLTAFVTPARPGLRSSDIMAYLIERVPSYLVPETTTVLAAIPLTAAGKVDTQALREIVPPAAGELPEADGSAHGGGTEDPRPVDDVEASLAKIFEDLLDRRPVGRHEDFFDIGGHSLLGVQLMFRIDEKFGCTIPVSVLFDIEQPGAATVAGLAVAVRERITRSPAEPAPDVVRLRLGGDRPPLFLLPPGGGELLSYRDLVERLDVGRPVYALEALPPGADGAGPQVTALGEHYAGRIRTVAPDGPCVLAGWSFGGALAYETARVLRRAGHEVKHIVLLDAHADVPARSDATLVAEFTEELGRIRDVALPLDADTDAAHTADARLNKSLALAAEAGIEAAGVEAAGIEAAGITALWTRFLLYRSHAMAAAEYRPLPQPIQLVLVQPVQEPQEERERALWRWESLVDSVAHYVVGGDHYSMLTSDRADELAKVLRTVLDAGDTA